MWYDGCLVSAKYAVQLNTLEESLMMSQLTKRTQSQHLSLKRNVIANGDQYDAEHTQGFGGRVHKSNNAKILLEEVASHHQKVGSDYFKTFEKAIIKRELSELVSALEALNFEEAEVTFASLLTHMSESDLSEIMVEKGIIGFKEGHLSKVKP